MCVYLYLCTYLCSYLCVYLYLYLCVYLYLYLCVYFHVEGLFVRCKGGDVCVYGAALMFIRKLQITQNFPNCENLPKIKKGKGHFANITQLHRLHGSLTEPHKMFSSTGKMQF